MVLQDHSAQTRAMNRPKVHLAGLATRTVLVEHMRRAGFQLRLHYPEPEPRKRRRCLGRRGQLVGDAS